MGGSSAPQAYMPTNQAGADASYTRALDQNTSNISNLWGQTQPLGWQSVQNLFANPGNASALSGAWDVSKLGQQTGHQQIERGNQAAGLDGGIIASGWDPQSANYNWGLGQTLSTIQSQNAQSGVAGSPFGAGVAGDAAASFQRQWQAGAQDRQGKAVQQLATNDANATGQQKAGLQTLEASQLLPSAVYNDQQMKQLSSLAAYVQMMSGINSASNQNVAGYGQYLNIGQNATSLDQNASKLNNAGGGIMGALGSIAGLGTGDGNTVGGAGLSSLLAFI